MRNKFFARKFVAPDGSRFDSRAEYARWLELQEMAHRGEISGLERQVRYEIIPKQDGERAAYYVADFCYEKGGQKIAEDAKSPMTKRLPEYVLKRKLFKLRYGKEITFCEWVKK